MTEDEMKNPSEGQATNAVVDASRRALVARLRARAIEDAIDPDRHPDAESLVAYGEGRLEAADADDIRRHLIACPACASLLLELDSPFADEDRPAADIDRGAVWRGLRTQLAERDRESTSRPSGASRMAPGKRVSGRMALAAGLGGIVLGGLLAAGILARRTSDLESRLATLEAPQLNAPIVYLDPITRGEDAVPGFARESGRRVLLIVTPEADEAYRRFRLTIADLEGNVAFRADSLALSDHGTLRLSLAADFLPVGSYTLTVFGLDGALDAPGERALGTFALRVHDERDDER